ncbi:DUF5681 domain-containing protein [Paraburkholderia dipogonis]|uniref:DUF5681 domain-containing protein n=1 Tax=Paraburkholderia dipogonis TaxID=1211383 RepID=UPI0038BC6742
MTSEKGAGTRFKPGQSGNPAGPAKALDKSRRALARLIADNAAEICATTLRLALAGDPSCAAAMTNLIASGFAEASAAGKNAAVGPGARSTPMVIDGELA